MGDLTSINIIGCCVSRTIFNVEKGRRYKVEGYVQRNLIFDLFDEVDEEYQVSETEVTKYAKHNFNRRTLRILINGTGRENILSRKGKWIVLDTHYSGSKCGIIRYPDGKKRVIQSEYIGIVKKIFSENSKFKYCSVELVDACDYFDKNLGNVVKFLKDNWGSNIILIDCPRTSFYMSEEGRIEITSVSYIDSITKVSHMYELLIKNIDCYYVKMPSILIGDYYDEYFASSVHYISEIYDYLKEVIDVIVDDSCINKERNIDFIRLKYEITFQKIVLLEWASEKNTANRIKRILLNADEKAYSKAYDLCNMLIS